jgi:repressor LexA
MKKNNDPALTIVLDTIKKLTKEKGYPPTVRELGKAVGYRSTNTVHDKLTRLQEEGLIDWEPSKTRTIRVLEG